MSNEHIKVVVEAVESVRKNPETAGEDVKKLLQVTRQDKDGTDAAMAIATIAENGE